MYTHKISNVLTLNQKDFVRYAGVTVVHPNQIVKP